MLTVSVKKSISDYYAYHGRLPANNQAAGAPPPEQLIGNYVSRVDVINGNILVAFRKVSGDEGIARQTLSWAHSQKNGICHFDAWREILNAQISRIRET